MRIHELEYEVGNELNMQARTKDYPSWGEYWKTQYRSNSEIRFIVSWQLNDHILVYDFYMDGARYRHHAYIMQDWME